MAYNLGRIGADLLQHSYQWLCWMTGEFARMIDFWHCSTSRHGFRRAQENRADF